MIANNRLLQTFNILATKSRLHGIPTPIIAITGGIATGKSTVVEYLIQKGFAVLCADKLIKEIYQQEATKSFLKENVSHVIASNGEIDFKKLRAYTFDNDNFKQQLEQFLYLKLPEAFWENYKKIPASPYFFYEVPLLFEKNLQSKVDVIVLLSTTPQLQLERLNSRDSSTTEINEKIIKAQMSFEIKQTQAHFILDNNRSNHDLLVQIDQLLSNLPLILKP